MAAYRRSDALRKRAKLMQDWTRYCAQPTAGAKVVPIRHAVR